MTGEGEGEGEALWVREATQMEVSFDQMARQEILLVVYKVAVASSVQLTHSLVSQALSYLYRTVPSLRVCLRDKDGAKWFQEMPRENIDFQVRSESTSVEEVAQELNTYKYNSSEGPLWCVRLLPVRDPAYTPLRFSSFCGDLRLNFPHCYYLLFGFNHCMGDGHSYRKIVGHFISLLDDVVDGKPLRDAEQLGKFVLNAEFDASFKTHAEELMSDAALKQKYVDEAKKGEPEKLLLEKLLPSTTTTSTTNTNTTTTTAATTTATPDKRTLVLTQTFDSEVTDRFVRKCKEHRISVNSGLSAACIAAYAQLLKEEGVEEETYAVGSSHLINVRRYWDPETARDNLGCSIGFVGRQFAQTPPSLSSEEFWVFAKGVHNDFYSLLNSGDVMYRLAFAIMCCLVLGEPYLDRDLTFNSLGDLTPLFAGRKHVQVTQLVNTSSIHTTTTVWDHIASTVRGRLLHSIKYSSGLISGTLVRRYMDLIHARVLQVTG